MMLPQRSGSQGAHGRPGAPAGAAPPWLLDYYERLVAAEAALERAEEDLIDRQDRATEIAAERVAARIAALEAQVAELRSALAAAAEREERRTKERDLARQKLQAAWEELGRSRAAEGAGDPAART